MFMPILWIPHLRAYKCILEPVPSSVKFIQLIIRSKVGSKVLDSWTPNRRRPKRDLKLEICSDSSFIMKRSRIKVLVELDFIQSCSLTLDRMDKMKALLPYSFHTFYLLFGLNRAPQNIARQCRCKSKPLLRTEDDLFGRFVVFFLETLE